MATTLSTVIEALADGRIEVVDLTQPLGPETPVIQLPPEFGASPPLTVTEISRYDERGPAWYWNTLTLGEHTGTHFDAPIHWVTGRELAEATCDTIPASRFVGPACVIDVETQVAADEDFLVTSAVIHDFESRHGAIPADSWVLIRSGWHRRKGADFANARDDGPHSPGFHADATRLLIERDVLGVGVETIGTDAGQAAGFKIPFPSHTLMHGAGKFGLASLCNLDRLPPTGALLIAAPLKLAGGSGSPLRVLALVER